MYQTETLLRRELRVRYPAGLMGWEHPSVFGYAACMSSTSHKDDLIEHDERAWGRRLQLPVQLGLGTVTTTQRRRPGA